MSWRRSGSGGSGGKGGKGTQERSQAPYVDGKKLKKEALSLVAAALKKQGEEGDIRGGLAILEQSLATYITPDGLYNKALMLLQALEEEHGDDDASLKAPALQTPLTLFYDIIKADTSKRGETTALAHRALANTIIEYLDSIPHLIAANSTQQRQQYPHGHVFSRSLFLPPSTQPPAPKHYSMCQSKQELFEMADAHFQAALNVLVKSQKFDSYLLEYANLHLTSLSHYVDDMKASKDHLTSPTNLQQTLMNATTRLEKIISITNEAINSPFSSGVDSEIFITKAEVYKVYWDFINYLIRCNMALSSTEAALGEGGGLLARNNEIMLLLQQKENETQSFLNNYSKVDNLEIYELVGDVWITLCGYYYSRGDINLLRLGISEALKARMLMISNLSSPSHIRNKKPLVIASIGDTLWSLSTGFGSRLGLPSTALLTSTSTSTSTNTSECTINGEMESESMNTNLKILMSLFDYLKQDLSYLLHDMHGILEDKYAPLLAWVSNEQVLHATCMIGESFNEMDMSRLLAGWTKIAYVSSICHASCSYRLSLSQTGTMTSDSNLANIEICMEADEETPPSISYEDSMEFISECLYNLSCCLWFMGDKDACMQSLQLYLHNVHSLEIHRHRDVIKAIKAREQAIVEILADSDFVGLQGEEGFQLLINSQI